MKQQATIAGSSVFSFVVLMAFCGAARAEVLQSFSECVPGKRVATSDNHIGTITRLDPAWSYCYVRQDDTGKEISYLYSLLQPLGAAHASGGGPAAAGGNQLASGVYECFADGRYAFVDIRITGPNSYVSAGQTGRYHVEKTGKIVYETGPLNPYYSKILEGHRIGLNTDGDRFYATGCELNRNKH